MPDPRESIKKAIEAQRKMREAAEQAKREIDAERKRQEAEERGEEYTGGDGMMVRTANGNFTYSHHWVVGKHAAAEVRRYLDLFGLSPSARAKVSTSDNRQGQLFEEGTPDQWSAL